LRSIKGATQPKRQAALQRIPAYRPSQFAEGVDRVGAKCVSSCRAQTAASSWRGTSDYGVASTTGLSNIPRGAYPERSLCGPRCVLAGAHPQSCRRNQPCQPRPSLIQPLRRRGQMSLGSPKPRQPVGAATTVNPGLPGLTIVDFTDRALTTTGGAPTTSQ
jgi:hypothetical protein